MGKRIAWGLILNWGFFCLAVFVCLLFAAMQLGDPLAPSFLQGAGGWSVACIGMLGSFQALGIALLGLFVGRVSGGAAGHGRAAEHSARPFYGQKRGDAVFEPWPGLLVGQALVWMSALILLLDGSFPLRALAFVLRGAHQGCRSLTQARASVPGTDDQRGLLLGATETTIATAQLAAPCAAGWLDASDSAYPFIPSLVLIPMPLLLGAVGSRV